MSFSRSITCLLALAFLAGVLLSWPLWYAAVRPAFPALPATGPAYREPAWLSVLSIISLLGSLLSLLFFHRRKSPWIVLLVTVTGLCLLDVNRLQPWVWLYGVVGSVLLSGKKEADTRYTLRWLLAAVYIWSGLHKCTPYFAVDNFAWFCSAFSWTKPLGNYPVLGYTAAIFEMALGFGLLWSRSRPSFRWFVLLFHAIIVLILSPLGLHWNTVVIPWNLALAGLVWLVFSGTDQPVLPESGVQRSLVALVALAPVLYFVGLWPEALSWKLYSNTQPEATFYQEAGFLPTVPGQPYTFDHNTKLLLDDWANAELGVPLFSSDRTFRQMGTYLCNCNPQPDSAGLYILTVPPFGRGGERWRKMSCRELLGK